MKITVSWGVSTYAFHYFNLTVMISSKYCTVDGARGGVVVKALRYKPAGRGFDS
jgi:hypothetical protein